MSLDKSLDTAATVTIHRRFSPTPATTGHEILVSLISILQEPTLYFAGIPGGPYVAVGGKVELPSPDPEITTVPPGDRTPPPPLGVMDAIIGSLRAVPKVQ